MAFPILEGLQLVNGVRSLWHEIKGNRELSKANALSSSNSISSTDFATLLAAQLKANAATSSTKSIDFSQRPLQTLISNTTTNFQAKVAAFREELGNIFSNAGITGIEKLDLTTDSDGNVVVANDNPNKDKIEALFAAHPALKLAFQRLSAQASLTRTAIDNFPMGGYLLDPQGAVTSYGTLLSGTNSPQNFHLVVGPTGVSTYFGESESTTTSASTTSTKSV